MTKKEQAAHDKVVSELKLQLALHWTAPIMPDVPPPVTGSNAHTVGWLPVGVGGYARVEPGCSSSIYHSTGRTDKTTSQGTVSLYSSRLSALKMLRYNTELAAAHELRLIDKMIEAEEQNRTPLPKKL